MSDYAEFFLNTPGSVVGLECLEISHTNFTQTWRLVRNGVKGVTVQHDGSSYAYQYCPMKISTGGSRADLDHKLTITLGDVGEIMQAEMDAIVAEDGFEERPRVKYRVYRSDRLDTPIYGPISLEISKVACTPEGSSFEASAPSLNVSKTGELYTLARFPMLRGFL